MHNQLNLFSIAHCITNNHTMFWFVGKENEKIDVIYTFNIIRYHEENTSSINIYFDESDLIICGINVLSQKQIVNNKISKIRPFFEYYSTYGIFFKYKREAIYYLYLRKIMTNCKLSYDAQAYIDKYPECLI